VAVTPGKVVFRNELIEVIQYAPTTKDVHAEPVLIVPAWIMKYYILDLSPRNSMVKYLVDQGHTVFMMSWKNPDEGDRDLGMDDYLEQGLKAAIDAVATMVPKQKIHAVGYCIGGTLLAIGAAMLGRAKDERLASVTMFAAQTDFSEPGELAFFINPGQLATLDATMFNKGVLESRQMGGAFALLRGQDLIWQPLINNYLKGKRDPMIDLMAWNADGTRMPWRMHSEYLYRLYLENELATNRFMARRPARAPVGHPAADVRGGHRGRPRGALDFGLQGDNLVRSDDFTFLLTAGGHNAGIICGPVHPKRSYRCARAGWPTRTWRPRSGPRPRRACRARGGPSGSSGWPSIPAARPSRRRWAPRATTVLEDAPGQYVHMK
jgi:polyhydroxyalkanoate synthase